MASIHKESVRQELDRLNGDFSRPAKGKELSSEISVLMNSMLMLMEFIERSSRTYVDTPNKSTLLRL